MYEKTNWVDGETPLSAQNMNKIENQLEKNTNDIAVIIESGSNDNGSWIKYSDGNLIQRGTAQCSASVGYADVTFPVAFINTDYTIISNHKYTSGDGFGGSQQLTNITSPQPYSTTQAYIYSYLYDGNIATYIRNVQYIAIGKWK